MKLMMLPIILIIISLILIIPIMVGTYVYKDAKQRNMDAVLWTAISILVPSFIGFIIYLVIRNNIIAATCTECKTPVEADWVLCPRCGCKLSNTKVQTQFQSKKDKSLIGVIIIIIIIPILLFLIGLASFASFTTTNLTSMSQAYNINATELNNIEIENWTRTCDEKGKGVYLLNVGSSDNYNAYIYINDYKNSSKGRLYHGTAKEEGKKIVVRYSTDTMIMNKATVNYELSNIEFNGKLIKQTIIYIDGKKVDFSESTLN